MDRAHRTESAVGGGRSTETHDDAFSTEIEGFVDQLARAGGGCRDGIVRVGPTHECEAGCARHLDHGRAAMKTPGRFDHVSEWPGDWRNPVRAAECIECSLASVGQCDLCAVDAEVPTRVPHCLSRALRRQRSFELVESRHHAHRPSLLVDDHVGGES